MEKENIIDLRGIINKLKSKRRTYYIVLPIAFILSCLFIISIPRYYNTTTSLAPEINSSNTSSTIGSIAANLGFDISDMQTSDAISPLLYPDLMEDNKFVSKLLPIRITDKTGTLNTTYYNYIKTLQKHPWWNYPIGYVKKLFASKDSTSKSKSFDPYWLSAKDNSVIEGIRNNIKVSVDKKTGVLTISVTDQDPLICRTVADSVRELIQTYITEYRTSKAKNDLEYYKKLTAKAKADYEKARQIYATYSDANIDVTLQSFKSKEEDLENEMQLKYNNYSSLSNQLQAAIAKVQERTPVFTTLKGASVPLKPAGPKRMIFVLSIVILTFFGLTFWFVRKDLHFMI